MARKPSYETLEKRYTDLSKEHVRLTGINQSLRSSNESLRHTIDKNIHQGKLVDEQLKARIGVLERELSNETLKLADREKRIDDIVSNWNQQARESQDQIINLRQTNATLERTILNMALDVHGR